MFQIQSRIRLDGYLDTRIGGREENQDSCGFLDSVLGALVVVCDGMGGMNGGSTASSLAVKSILDVFGSAELGDDPVKTIRRSISVANDTIIQAGRDDPSLMGMGTTLTLLLLSEDCAYVAYIGDSRVYQLRSGKKVFRTFDDSVVFQLVKSGAISEEEARVAGNSNVITKALGIKEEVDCDVECLPYDKNDRFFLCTDGFWGPLPEVTLLSLMGKNKDELPIVFERALNKIENAARDRYPNHYDNLTAAVVDVKQYSKRRSKMEKKLKFTTICLSVLLLVSLGMLLFNNNENNAVSKALHFRKAAFVARTTADSLSKEASVLDSQAVQARESAREAEENASRVVSKDGKSSEAKGLLKDAKSKKKLAGNYDRKAKKARSKSHRASNKAGRLDLKASNYYKKAEKIIPLVDELKIANSPSGFNETFVKE